jgi:hypothetical protein
MRYGIRKDKRHQLMIWLRAGKTGELTLYCLKANRVLLRIDS